ncbi:MAG TPA: flavoprotein [Ktedonobacteraceae bacterium]|nr:flavoprotein [Ktedonobacteraceae bacterium]
MSRVQPAGRGVLYVIACAAPPAQNVQEFVVMAQQAKWMVCVIATPHALKFVDVPLIQQLTGYPVRSEYKKPEDPDILPRADAFVVLPATFNTLNKLAQGITDTLAVGLLCEYLCLGIPIVAVPNFHEWDMGRHPAIKKSITTLRECGMCVLYEPEKYPPSNNIPWNQVLEELHKQVERAKKERSGLRGNNEQTPDLMPRTNGPSEACR